MRRRDFLLTVPGIALAAQTPSPGTVRRGHTLVYDSSRRELLVFGGAQPVDVSGFEPLLAFRRGRWQPLKAQGPRSRSLVAGAFDQRHKLFVTYGGAGPSYSTRYGDLWTWNGAVWSESPVSGEWPGPRDHHAMAYDSNRGRIVMYGGATSLTRESSVWYTDTWEWNGEKWRRFDVPGPGQRVHHAVAYDPVRRQTVVAGGHGEDSIYRGDTWGWDGTVWTNLASSGYTPRARQRLAFHDSSGELVLYGGDSGRGEQSFNVLSDTWVWNGSRWMERTPVTTPGPRFMHAMTYDSDRRLVVLCGGKPGEKVADDTWAWDGGNWRSL